MTTRKRQPTFSLSNLLAILLLVLVMGGVPLVLGAVKSMGSAIGGMIRERPVHEVSTRAPWCAVDAAGVTSCRV